MKLSGNIRILKKNRNWTQNYMALAVMKILRNITRKLLISGESVSIILNILQNGELVAVLSVD
ncbi:hypothetical protein D0466_14300 [Peribacillus glennii]|uniref:Uncharacterized protein n=1 Tax=Peribacillus glennii TaxID=2303991 RepID=A0A372L9U8_9BACI|nr:hypothetical protein D0466_14300 [Peribacillus glennii]